MKFSIPDYVKKIIEKLEAENYQVFIVGGSVRDLLLGKEPSDFDITTNAKPDEIEEVFSDYKTILVGREFGTVVVVTDAANLEITTYRIEGEYKDGRRPSEVIFSTEIEGDLSRRDFTVNAMAYNSDIGLVDLFNGREDLKRKTIKTVGNPEKRFNEDHLRILRAIRFATQLDFSIEEDTKKACMDMAYLLKEISAERIREELFKILLSEKPSYGIKLMKQLNVLQVIIPELMKTVGFDQKNPHHDKDIFNHTLCVVDNTPPILEVRLAALLHDIGKPDTFTLDEEGIGHFYGHDKVGVDISKIILKRLRCSNKFIQNVISLVDSHMTHHNDYKEKGLKRLIKRIGSDRIFNLLELQKADRICSSKDRDIEFLNQRKQRILEILEGNEAYDEKQLAINGNDIIELGYKQGKVIGEILEYLMEKVMEDSNLNTKEKLIQLTLEEFKNSK